MKKLLTLLAFVVIGFTTQAQTRITKDINGNYKMFADTGKLTNNTLTDINGEIHPLYVNNKGKLFYYKVSKKTNKKYKSYISATKIYDQMY